MRFRARCRDGNGHGGGCGLTVSSWALAKGGIFNSRGSTPTFTRATGASVRDFENLIKTAIASEVRGYGMRRVDNYIRTCSDMSPAPSSEDFSVWGDNGAASISTGVEDPLGGTTAATVTATSATGQMYATTATWSPATDEDSLTSIWVRRRTGTGTISLFYGPNQLLDITSSLTATWQRFSCGATAGNAVNRVYAGVQITTSGDAVDVAFAQIENVTGQANQNPSEYVSVGVASAPYHGWGVDGVKYFPWENGNTVSSNVVSEAQGSAISAAMGYRPEGARTNICLQSEDLATSWTNTNSTDSANATTAPDGRTSADQLIEDATAGVAHYLSQSITYTNKRHAFSVFAKANAVTVVQIALNDGTTNCTCFFDVSGGTVGTAANCAGYIEAWGGGWYRCEIVSSSALAAAAGSCSLILTDNTENITYDGDGSSGAYFWGMQIEALQNANDRKTDYIKTTTAAVTRNGDDLKFPSAGNIPETGFAIYLQFARPTGFKSSNPVTSPLSIGTYAGDAYLSVGGYDAGTGVMIGSWADVWDLVYSQASFFAADGTLQKYVCRMNADGLTVRQFANGTADDESTASGGAKASNWNAAVISIGSVNGNAGVEQNLIIAEARIYNRVPSDARLQGLSQ